MKPLANASSPHPVLFLVLRTEPCASREQLALPLRHTPAGLFLTWLFFFPKSFSVAFKSGSTFFLSVVSFGLISVCQPAMSAQLSAELGWNPGLGIAIVAPKNATTEPEPHRTMTTSGVIQTLAFSMQLILCKIKHFAYGCLCFLIQFSQENLSNGNMSRCAMHSTVVT